MRNPDEVTIGKTHSTLLAKLFFLPITSFESEYYIIIGRFSRIKYLEHQTSKKFQFNFSFLIYPVEINCSEIKCLFSYFSRLRRVFPAGAIYRHGQSSRLFKTALARICSSY